MTGDLDNLVRQVERRHALWTLTRLFGVAAGIAAVLLWIDGPSDSLWLLALTCLLPPSLMDLSATTDGGAAGRLGRGVRPGAAVT